VIFRGRLKSSPVIDVTFDGISMNYQSIGKVELMLDENKHDTLIVTIRGMSPRLLVEMINVPIKATWYVGSTGHTFIGYVYSVNPQTVSKEGLVNNSPFQRADVVCLGASSAMRGKQTRVWSDVSLNTIVSKIAEDYRISYSVPSVTPTFQRLFQDGKSDWEFLVNTCTDVGLSVTMHGTHLTLWDNVRYLARRSSYHEILSLRTPAARTVDAPGRILDFSASLKTNSGVVASGVDRSGTVFSSVGPYPANTGAGREATSTWVDTIPINFSEFDLADSVIRSANTRTFPFTAEATVTGIAGCIPGGIVNVVDFGSDIDGLWCVSGVKHVAMNDRFITKLSLASFTHNADPVDLPPSISLLEPPTSTLVEGSWVSSLMMSETYA
jgi:hypothetical protein